MTDHNEPFISVPRALVVEIDQFTTEWLEDFQDYAKDSMSDDEQAERQQELERIERISAGVQAVLDHKPAA